MTEWLLDKSGYVRVGQLPAIEAQPWFARVDRGLVRIGIATRLELGYSARSGDYATRLLAGPPVSLMPVEYLTPAAEDRAVDVLIALAGRGQHRSVSLPDLLTAATAELAGLTVLTGDRDFERIAAITGQPVEVLADPLA